MSKQGQAHHDTPERNNPSKSQEITTGTYKKHETTHQQHKQHQKADATPQDQQVPHEGARNGRTLESTSRALAQQSEPRAGSESNAQRGRKGSGLDAHHHDQDEV
jgi:hypothetical protein